MKILASAAAVALLIATGAIAETGGVHPLSTLPQSGAPVKNYYKQNVYDASDNKIGEVSDLLLDKDGRVSAAIVSVGGFVGVGEKDVAVPFDALRLTQKNQKWYLVMNADKDALKSAPGFKYDKSKDRWVPEAS